MNERDYGLDQEGQGFDVGGWVVRGIVRVATGWRPDLGWLVLAVCMVMSTLPALLMWESGWLRVGSLQNKLLWVGPLAVVITWAILGWRRWHSWGRRRFRIATQSLVLLISGALVTTQLLGSWIPDPSAWWVALTERTWEELVTSARDALWHLLARYLLWWQGVQADAATRDDLVLAGIAAALIWSIAVLAAVLARRTRRGLPAAVAVLWPVGFVMLYSPAERWLFVVGVALALLLHLLLDQQALVRRWQAAGLDFNPALLGERAVTALAGMLLVLFLAMVIPNLYWTEITGRYYVLLEPVNKQLEAMSQRAFPGLTGVNRWGSRGIAGGLPNEFLILSGPELGEQVVMRVRTNEPAPAFDQPPRGYTLRGATFSDYDGRGWHNPPALPRSPHPAEQSWTALPDEWRRTLMQSVNLAFTSQVIFAAGEPLAPSVDYQAEERFPGDLVSMIARVRSYTVASLVPALSDEMLAALPDWGVPGYTLPDAYGEYLALPDTVTNRTHALAMELVAGQPTLYARATAIERYLRTFPYDLTVPAVSDDVTDVADYFLFDLRRGYCDYYATAFVVLARAAGIPARFVTGYAPGYWNASEQLWIITEAEAHSWPEVYFPEAGWIPFEPTAGRPELARIGRTTPSSGEMVAPPFEPLGASEWSPSWERLWWLLPGLLAAAGVVLLVRRWLAGREDPWLGLLRWGRRLGRPFADGDTVLEYGEALAGFVQDRRAHEPEVGRTVAREVRALSQEVSALNYAPEMVRPDLRARVMARWRRLRAYLRRV
ncbi:MAG: transglutaminase domain-containing protein [Caldilineaceae bacterium]|nr:transglutaminase domain-containing protein [Caldilineaceae bacterium]